MSVKEYLNTLIGVEQVLSLKDSKLYVEGWIGWVVMDAAGKSVNVMSPELSEQTVQVLDKLDQLVNDGHVKLIIFTSGKPNTFVAGADIDVLFPQTDPLKVFDLSRGGQEVLNRIEAIKVPTVAAINGAALGGGLELALACQYRVAADTAKTVLGLPEVKLGLLPGAGGTLRLPRLIGLQQSLPIILPGGQVKPAKAKKLGIVDAVLPHDDIAPHTNTFFTNVRAYATKLIGKKARPIQHYQPKNVQDRLLENTAVGHYVVASQAAKGLDKQTKGQYPASYFALDAVMQGKKHANHPAQAFIHEARDFAILGTSPEHKALTSLFKMFNDTKDIQKHTGGAKPIDVKSVGVIGAGVMGWQIAALTIAKKHQVYMRDIKQEFVTKGLKQIEGQLQAKVAKKRMTPEALKKQMALVKGGTDLKPFNQCQLLIEAAVEQMPLKKKILAEIEQSLPDDVIFGTNTSSLSITELATASKRPENVVGVHFFNPVSKMPLVEIIRGEKTSDQATATAYQYALSLGKIPIVCKDGPGFIVNRILGIYMNEAGHLALEGVPLPEVDQALLEFGMPMGPYRLMDEVGLDVAGHVGPILHAGLGERYAQSPEFPKLLEENKQYLGKKTGAGFYTYNGEKQGPLNTPVISQLKKIIKPHPSGKPDKQTIIDRCVLLELNEAVYVLDEGIVERPEDLDLAMVTGTGFAPFRGGLLSYAEARGLNDCVMNLGLLQQRYGDRFKPHPKLVEMARTGQRFFPNRPNPKALTPIKKLPYSKLSAKL